MAKTLLTPDALERIESESPEGISSKDVVDLFQGLGVKLSEATFRKYVQQGLLPGCIRRVGEKGKHKGSRGIYPVSVVRRVNLIKKMMDEGLTLEDIRHSFLAFRNDIDALQEALDTLFRDFEAHMKARELEAGDRKVLARQFRETRSNAGSLVKRLEKLGSAIAARPMTGAPGSGVS